MLKIQNLSTYYYLQDKTVKAVDDISFNLPSNSFTGLVGPSGCGKSTIGFSIMNLIQPPGKIENGKIFVDSTNILSLTRKELSGIRGRLISMVFQDPFSYLNPVIKVGEQVSEQIRYHLSCDKIEAKRRTIALFETVKISEPQKAYEKYPHQLSGGQRQRIIIAQAISCGAKYIIADEPTTALDVVNQKEIMDLLKEMQRSLEISILLITHNQKLVEKYCDSVLRMDNGRLL